MNLISFSVMLFMNLMYSSIHISLIVANVEDMIRFNTSAALSTK